MDIPQEPKKSTIGIWIFLSVLVFVIGFIIIYCINLQNQQSSDSDTSASSNSTNNQQLLQTCIQNNVNPIEQRAEIDPGQSQDASSEETAATQACEAEYPTN